MRNSLIVATHTGSELNLSKSGSDLKLKCHCARAGDTAFRFFRACFAVRNFISVSLIDTLHAYKMVFLTAYSYK